jgi:hypothetical protein
MADYEVGYGKPPKEYAFKPGEVNNPGGKTSEHRKAEIKAAEIAAKSRLDLVEAFARLVQGGATDEDKWKLVDSDALRLLKESEDRGFGQPKSSVDLSSEDGSMSPRDHSDAVLDALRAKHGVDNGND